MAVKDYAINRTLAQRAELLPSIGVAFENAPLTEQPDLLYVVEAYLPSPVQPVGMENGSTDDHRGIYQLTVMAPKSKYKKDGMQAAQKVVDHFPRGMFLEANGVRVRIEKSTQAPALPSTTTHWPIPVSVYYRSLVK